MLEELNRVAKEVAELYGKHGIFPTFRARGDDNHPSVQITSIDSFRKLAEEADQEPVKGYYHKGNREYHFYHDGVEYFALSEEEEN